MKRQNIISKNPKIASCNNYAIQILCYINTGKIIVFPCTKGWLKIKRNNNIWLAQGILFLICNFSVINYALLTWVVGTLAQLRRKFYDDLTYVTEWDLVLNTNFMFIDIYFSVVFLVFIPDNGPLLPKNVKFENNRTIKCGVIRCFKYYYLLYKCHNVMSKITYAKRKCLDTDITSTVPNKTEVLQVCWHHNQWSQVQIFVYETPVCCSAFDAWKLEFQ
jgi:hypothetical protein